MRTFLLFLISIFISGWVHAQDHPFNAGLLIGGNGIEIKGDKEMQWGTGGLTLGAYVNTYISDRLALKLEMKYIKKGSIYVYNNVFGLEDWEALKLNYIELPLVTHYYFKADSRCFFLEGGFAYAYLFSKTYTNSRMGTGEPNTRFEGYKRNDFSLIGGLGYRFISKKDHNFSILFRASRSIVSIHNSLKLYNVVYGVSFYYQLNKNR